MQKELTYIILLSAAMMAACSSDDSAMVNPDAPADKAVVFAGPDFIATRSATALQDVGRYNFGMFAFKKQSSATDDESVPTMWNFLVGYDDGSNAHYSSAKSTTWAAEPSLGKSPWFYEGLDGQPLVYWDRSYDENEFVYYSPYHKSDSVSVDRAKGTMTLNGIPLNDGYVNPVAGSPYEGNDDPATSEFLYGSTTVAKASYGNNVSLPFKHFNAQVELGFYSAMDKYYVEIADLDADGGRIKDGVPAYEGKGIQCTPAGCVVNSSMDVETISESKAKYITGYNNVTFKFGDKAFEPDSKDATESSDNLMFRIPDTESGNLTAHVHDGITHYCVAEKAADGAEQSYSVSPTTYYAMPQDQYFRANVTAGFTLHMTLRLIPKTAADSADHKATTIHNAMVYIPPFTGQTLSTANWLTMWQSGRRYVYHFRITNNVAGSTDPAKVIDPEGTQPTTGIELVDFDVYVPDPATHSYKRTTIKTITAGEEDPDQPADSKKNSFD